MTSPALRDVVLPHLDYTAWASGLLLDACAALPEEELNRERQASHGSLLGTLRHIYYADRVWYRRLAGAAGTQTPFRDPAPEPTLADLRRDWMPLLRKMRDWAAALGADELAADLHYQNLKGDPFSASRWQILMHVVNHATLHRGQVIGMLRQSGHKPPTTDLIYFYLSLRMKS